MPLVCPPVADAGKVWRERVSVRGAVSGRWQPCLAPAGFQGYVVAAAAQVMMSAS